jgi:hypothetical protein
VQFDVDYPARPLNRLTTTFRIFVAIPILIVLGALPTAALHTSDKSPMYQTAIGSGLVFLSLVFRWGNRVTGYAFTLVTEQYPPFRLN